PGPNICFDASNQLNAGCCRGKCEHPLPAPGRSTGKHPMGEEWREVAHQTELWTIHVRGNQCPWRSQVQLQSQCARSVRYTRKARGPNCSCEWVNGSTCKAGDSSKSDVVYSWTFNNHVIHFTGRNDDSATYSIPNAVTSQDGTLYITSAKYRHEGMYGARPLPSQARFLPKGPPGEPGWSPRKGEVKQRRRIRASLELWWEDGQKYGYDVTYYIIEYRSFFDDRDAWTVWRDEYYSMASAPPIYPPDNVGGGGGAGGTPFRLSGSAAQKQVGSQGTIAYTMYFPGPRKRTRGMRHSEETYEDRQDIIHQSGRSQQLLPRPYTVKVQARNPEGSGPNPQSTTGKKAHSVISAWRAGGWGHSGTFGGDGVKVFT
ncbi:hypothetical protein RRG08_037212, partial [Elysia crispata]